MNVKMIFEVYSLIIRSYFSSILTLILSHVLGIITSVLIQNIVRGRELCNIESDT